MKKNFYKDLEKKYKEISLLYEAIGILHWDRSTFMPKNSIDGRTDQLTNLYVLSHTMLKDKKINECIKKSEKIKKLNIWEKKNLKLIKKEYILNKALDKKLLEKISRSTSDCEMQWRISKENNDFNSIIPKLDKVIKLRKIEAKIKSKILNCSLYDALLNDYEDDLHSDKIDKIFNQLTSFLPIFLKEVLNFQKKNKKIIHKIIAIDYGIKKNILRYFSNFNCEVIVVPCNLQAKEIIKLNPDGIFLSNGPGDPAATGRYAINIIQKLLKTSIPIFGICLGHQLLALALKAKTKKMKLGHRGANHPVKNLINNKVEITSQNHGFEIIKESLPKNVEVTHKSLFDNCIEGIKLKNRPVFSVQYHPESNPGPQDSHYLFKQFINEVIKNAKKKRH